MTLRVSKLFGELGPGYGLLYMLQHMAARLHIPVTLRAYLVVQQEVRATPRLEGGRASGFTSRHLDDDDPAMGEIPLDAATIAFRRAQGAQCLGLFRAGRLAAYMWYVLDGYDEDEVRCRFRPRPAAATAWDFDVYVAPEFRGGLAFAALWDHADAVLRAAGRAWTMSRISAFNTQSRASHRRLGAVELARASFIRAGALQIMISSQRPYVHAGFGDRSRPVLEIGG